MASSFRSFGIVGENDMFGSTPQRVASSSRSRVPRLMPMPMAMTMTMSSQPSQEQQVRQPRQPDTLQSPSWQSVPRDTAESQIRQSSQNQQAWQSGAFQFLPDAIPIELPYNPHIEDDLNRMQIVDTDARPVAQNLRLGSSTTMSNNLKKLEIINSTATAVLIEVIEPENANDDDEPWDLSRQCNICMSPYELQETKSKLPCNHLFHEKCLTMWLIDNNKDTCPMCRRPVILTAPESKIPDNDPEHVPRLADNRRGDLSLFF